MHVRSAHRLRPWPRTIIASAALALALLLNACGQPAPPPQGPAFISTPVRSATVGEAYLYVIDARSASGSTDIAMELDEGPAWLRFEDLGGGRATLRGTPGRDDVGAHDVRVSAWDRSINLARVQEFQVTVRASPAAMVAAGHDHSLMVSANGDLYAWGRNHLGQLGLGTAGGQRNEPQRLPGLDDVTMVAVAAGDGFSLALDADGGVWHWGRALGKPCCNDAVSSTTPQRVELPGGAVATAIAAGAAHALVATDGSGLFAWGANARGELGSGDHNWHTEPVALDTTGTSLTAVVAIAAGLRHSLALTGDGVVYGWGADERLLALETGTRNDVLRPTPIPFTTTTNGVRLAAITAAGEHSAAVATDGSVRVWGKNEDTTARRPFGARLPVEITSPALLASFPPSGEQAQGVHTAASFTLIHTTNGVVFGIGSNQHGTFGDGTTLSRDDAVRAALLTSGDPLRVAQLAAGPEHVVAIDLDGAVYAWGSNANGRLGDGSSASRDRPTRIR